METIAGVVILGTSLAAAVTDAARRRIPNALTLGVGAAGLAVGAAQEFGALRPLGTPSLLEMAACAAVALAVSVPLWRRGALGGGDAKLLVAVAVWGGAVAALEITCIACLAGLILAAVLAAGRGELPALFGFAGDAPGEAVAATDVVAQARSRRFPFGVALFLGACVWWLAGSLG